MFYCASQALIFITNLIKNFLDVGLTFGVSLDCAAYTVRS